MGRPLTADERNYLRGWTAMAAHTTETEREDVATYGLDWPTMALAVIGDHASTDGIEAWAAGRADAALAAYGLGDTDGADVGNRDCPRTLCLWRPGVRLPGKRCVYVYRGLVPLTGTEICITCGARK